MEQIIFQMCVFTHMHTHMKHMFIEQVNMIISEDKQQKKATFF